MRVLEIGTGGLDIARQVFGVEAEIVTVDADRKLKPDLVHDIRLPLPRRFWQAFDFVFASHVLEHVPWRYARIALNNMAQAVVLHGRIIVVVPDVEWAAKEIVKGNFDMSVFGVLYGGQANKWDHHNCGFTFATLEYLLNLMEGFAPVYKKTEHYYTKVEGTEYWPNQIVMAYERVAVRTD